MLNYIISELQRLLSKKQTYVFYGIFMVAFTLILVLAESEQTAGGMAMMGGALLSISSMVFGTRIFYDVVGDDLQHKTLSLVLTTGLSRLQFVLSKLIVFILATLLLYGVMALYFLGLWFIKVGAAPVFGSPEVNLLIDAAKITIISIFGFGSIGMAISYFFQNANAGGILFPLMTMGLTSQIMKLAVLAFNWLEKPVSYLLSSQSQNATTLIQMNQAIPKDFYIVTIVYILLGVILSTFALSKRDIQIN